MKITKGHVPWNKGLKGYRAGKKSHWWKGGKKEAICSFCNKTFYYWKSSQKGKYCSKTCSNIANAKPGEKNPSWKGGVSTETQIARGDPRLKRWRRMIFQRDNYTCQECHKKGGELNAHHIKSFSDHPDLRHVVSNGVCYCVDCHKGTDNYGFRGIAA